MVGDALTALLVGGPLVHLYAVCYVGSRWTSTFEPLLSKRCTESGVRGESKCRLVSFLVRLNASYLPKSGPLPQVRKVGQRSLIIA